MEHQDFLKTGEQQYEIEVNHVLDTEMEEPLQNNSYDQSKRNLDESVDTLQCDSDISAGKIIRIKTEPEEDLSTEENSHDRIEFMENNECELYIKCEKEEFIEQQLAGYIYPEDTTGEETRFWKNTKNPNPMNGASTRKIQISKAYLCDLCGYVTANSWDYQVHCTAHGKESKKEKAESSASKIRLKKKKKYSMDKSIRCEFCFDDVMSKKFVSHMEYFHRGENKIKDILQFPIGSKARRQAFGLLRQRAHYNLFIKNAEIRPYRNGIQQNGNTSEMHPCIYCKGIFKNIYLMQHEKKCVAKKIANDSDPVPKNFISDYQTLVACSLDHSNIISTLNVKKQVFNIMKADDISFEAKTDLLIIYFGESYLENREKYRERREHACGLRMRELARLLIAYKEIIENTTVKLKDILKPKNFDNIVSATKKVSGYDPENKIYRSPNLAIYLGTYLKLACDELMRLILKESTGFTCATTEELTRWKSETAAKSGNKVNGSSDRARAATFKKQYGQLCYFCRTIVYRLPRHLLRHHSKEKEVQQIKALPENSEERRKLLRLVRNKGNFFKPRAARESIKNKELLPCSNCLGFYAGSNLWRHRHRCTKEKLAKGKTHKALAQNFLLKDRQLDPELKDKVFARMRPDKISMVAKLDPIICEWATDVFKKYPFQNTSNKMRELAKLLMFAQNEEPSIIEMFDLLRTVHYPIIVRGVKSVSNYTIQTSGDVPPMVRSLTKSLKECCVVAMRSIGTRNISSSIIATELLKNISDLETYLHCELKEDVIGQAAEDSEMKLPPKYTSIWTDKQQKCLTSYFKENPTQQFVCKKGHFRKLKELFPDVLKDKTVLQIRDFVFRNCNKIRRTYVCKGRFLVQWTEEEKKATDLFFKNHIKNKTPPRKFECVKFMQKHPDLFETKTWEKIKVYVQNQYVKISKMEAATPKKARIKSESFSCITDDSLQIESPSIKKEKVSNISGIPENCVAAVYSLSEECQSCEDTVASVDDSVINNNVKNLTIDFCKIKSATKDDEIPPSESVSSPFNNSLQMESATNEVQIQPIASVGCVTVNGLQIESSSTEKEGSISDLSENCVNMEPATKEVQIQPSESLNANSLQDFYSLTEETQRCEDTVASIIESAINNNVKNLTINLVRSPSKEIQIQTSHSHSRSNSKAHLKIDFPPPNKDSVSSSSTVPKNCVSAIALYEEIENYEDSAVTTDIAATSNNNVANLAIDISKAVALYEEIENYEDAAVTTDIAATSNNNVVNLTIDISKDYEEKEVTLKRKKTSRKKTHICKFCQMKVTYYARHLIANHKNEVILKHFFGTSLQDRKKNVTLIKLRQKRKREKSSTQDKPSKISKNPQPKITDEKEIMTKKLAFCLHCQGYFNRFLFNEHRKQCKLASLLKIKKEESPGKNHIFEPDRKVTDITPMFNSSQTAFYDSLSIKDILFTIRHDEAAKTGIGDILICSYADRVFKKTKGRTVRNVVSNTIRELGRFLIQLKKITGINNLFGNLKPQFFDSLLEATEGICGDCSDVNASKLSYLPVKMGRVLKEICEVAINMIHVNSGLFDLGNDCDSIKPLNRLVTLIQHHWSSDLLKVGVKEEVLDESSDAPDISSLNESLSDNEDKGGASHKHTIKFARIRYSEEEKQLIRKFFKRHIKERESPKKTEVLEFMDKHKTLFKLKNWVKVKAFVYNEYRLQNNKSTT